MSASAFRIPGRLPTTLLGVFVLAAFLAAPDAAHATCGDHVQFRLPAGAPRPAAPVPDAPAKPCHGPNCSGGAPAPLVPPAPPAPSFDDHWGQPADGDSPTPPAGSARPTPLTSERPVRRTADVFHPPRRS